MKWNINNHITGKVYYLDQSNMNAMIKDIERLSKQREIYKDVYMQVYGLRNTWCGMWIKCLQCNTDWACGGNWNDKKDTEPCPFCCAKELE